MKKFTLISILFFLFVQINYSQNLEKLKAEKYIANKEELTFTFKVKDQSELDNFTKKLSILNFNPKTNTVTAWANQKQFREFESLKIPFKVPKSENEVDPELIYDNPASRAKNIIPTKGALANTLSFPVSNYPTYAEYAQQMQDFENAYPTLVEKISLGNTGENDGKELLFVKISDNVGTDEQEPKLMLTSSMHGDEIAGYPMMLSLIDYILTVYADTGHPDHTRIKNLVENAEIWINPSANPDGTYYGSANNTIVTGARRANANGLDLNRNYPDNVAGPHDDGNAYQTETIAFMALADAQHFVLSANFHGGVELINYPFDNAYVSEYTHPDGNWFEYIGVEYATNAQNDSDTLGDNTYMTVDYDSNVYPSEGVTHGAEWYRVFGGRQDYMNFYQQCKEITVELSDTKILPESQLANYWIYNKEALLDFLTQGTYGFRGVVKDANTGNPLDATVKLINHDNYGSHTFTDISHGDYYRPIKAGTYDILFESDCYQSFTLTSQTINDYETKVLADVLLTPIAGSAPINLGASNIATTTTTISWDALTGANYDYQYRQVGSPTWTTVNTSSNSITLTSLTHSTEYEVQVRSTCGGNTSLYSPSVFFTTTTPPPCSGTLITSFPYSQGFEGGIGDWYDDLTDDFDWTRDSDGTPTGMTGPSLASEGTWYMYTEADTNNGIATFLSPCFDLNNKSSASFNYDYSMYGSNTGSLNLEISTNDGTTWTSIWSLSGNQNTGWNTNTINIDTYVGNYVRLRFTADMPNTGNTRSDIAIDAIGLTAVDASITPIADCTDISITLDVNGNATITADAIDNGGSAGNLSIDVSNFDCSNIGPNNVTLTATDPSNSNNTDSCVAVVTVNQQTAPTPINCWDNYVYNSTSCIWENQGSQPAAPTTACYETATWNPTTCVWDITGTQPAAPTTACYETATWNPTTCVWDITGTQPAAPTTACYETATWNPTTCVWDITGTQPAAPTTACYETATWNPTTCVWDVTGTQPAAPTTACYETATWNPTTCVWDVTGTQPAAPTTACYETATWNPTTCVWDVTGTQPAAPTTACYETATWNPTTCVWDITGTQPAAPTTACYETATWNPTTCVWDITGTQPAAPTTACYETATWNPTTCVWDVTGTQPAAPTTACYETATWNPTTCVWDITGTQPAAPTTACYETATWNPTTCVWDVTGTQPAAPTTACYETATWNPTTCVWDVTGTQPAAPTTACYETATWNPTTCVWDITGTQPAAPTTACYETATWNPTTCVWDVTGTQPAAPTTACYETATWNPTTCVWDVTGTQPAAPTTACYETATWNPTTCVWDVTGTQPAAPTTACYETATWNPTTCVWDVTGTQPAAPTTACYETATWNPTTCVWDVTGTQPAAPTTACYETATWNPTTCVWDVTGTQPAAPTTACYETATWNPTTCVWDVTGTQPAAPTTACYETATWNPTTCVWDVTGTQPAAPTTACYETATWNPTTCVWDITGTQPAAPTTACYETATWNPTTCVWDITGTQPAAPTTACYETATWNPTTCVWDVTGTQPAAPTTACYETATWNPTTCVWDVTGTQPAAPTTACYETATWNPTTCVWDITGTQPAAPTTACYETATWNPTTCVWDVTGTQPAAPTTACYETATWNPTTCVWDVTGTQPAAPTTACYETATWNPTTCVWDVTGTQPAAPTTACYETATWNPTTCVWDVTGTQPAAPTTACYETATWNPTTCVWDVTGTQPAEPAVTNCWDDYQFNTTTCSWENQGSPNIYYIDKDGDGYGDPSNSVLACSTPIGYADNAEDCNDNNKNINPDTMWYIDADGDGFGNPDNGKKSCINPSQTGEVYILASSIDCDDSNPTVNPNGIEIPGNAIDEDCDGIAQTTLNNDVFNLENVNITPNPFNNLLKITVPLSFNAAKLNIVLYDVNGRYIYNRNQEVNYNGHIKISSGLSRLDEGVYFIKITNLSDGLSLVKKLIKY